MNKEESEEKLIQILKEGALKFRNDFNENLPVFFWEERNKEEIIVHFKIQYDRKLEYLLIIKKQATIADYIPNLKGYEKLEMSDNPFKKLRFTDENTMLGNIYDSIEKIDVAEIACYEKFGIILRNPLELERNIQY